jgi:hypothetical protein
MNGICVCVHAYVHACILTRARTNSFVCLYMPKHVGVHERAHTHFSEYMHIHLRNAAYLQKVVRNAKGFAQA